MGRIIAIFLGAAAVGVCGLWVRSYWRDDVIIVGDVVAVQGRGRVYFGVDHDYATWLRVAYFPPSQKIWFSEPRPVEMQWWPPAELWLSDDGLVLGVGLADWFLLLLLSPYPLWRSWRWWRRRKDPSRAGGRGFPVITRDEEGSVVRVQGSGQNARTPPH